MNWIKCFLLVNIILVSIRSDFSTIHFCSFYQLGSPFKFHVDSLASGYVTAYGPGLIYGVCGEPGNFNISTKDAGAGGLSLSVEGPSKAEISCHDNKDGTISVSYLPTAPGEYKIGVKFGDKHIRGSPYVAKITGIIDRDRLKNFQIKGKSNASWNVNLSREFLSRIEKSNFW